MAILQNTRAANATLVARSRVFRKSMPLEVIPGWGTGSAIRISAKCAGSQNRSLKRQRGPKGPRHGLKIDKEEA
jgi:hypothetical protein